LFDPSGLRTASVAAATSPASVLTHAQGRRVSAKLRVFIPPPAEKRARPTKRDRWR
jgi:hypothetical protein